MSSRWRFFCSSLSIGTMSLGSRGLYGREVSKKCLRAPSYFKTNHFWVVSVFCMGISWESGFACFGGRERRVEFLSGTGSLVSPMLQVVIAICQVKPMVLVICKHGKIFMKIKIWIIKASQLFYFETFSSYLQLIFIRILVIT